ncbi:MAG: hypothetical protein ACI9HG_002155, partial [Flavobacteriales bacterium]
MFILVNVRVSLLYPSVGYCPCCSIEDLLCMLNVYQQEEFKDILELLLTIVAGTMVIHELIGPITAKYS